MKRIALVVPLVVVHVGCDDGLIPPGDGGVHPLDASADAYTPPADAYAPPDTGPPSDAGHDAGERRHQESWCAEAWRDIRTGDPCTELVCDERVHFSETDPQAANWNARCFASITVAGFVTRDCGLTTVERTWQPGECEELLDEANDDDPCASTGLGNEWGCVRATDDCCFEVALCEDLAALGGSLRKGRVCNDNCDYALAGGRTHDRCPDVGDWAPGEPCVGDWICPDASEITPYTDRLIACHGSVLRVSPLFDFHAGFHPAYGSCLERP